jgi:uncharacterized protein involved in exopolysaccharide biosynthesis
MDVATARKAIRSRWLLVAAFTVAVAAIAVAFTILRPKAYTATAEGLVSVSAPQTRPQPSLANGSQYIMDHMASYAQLGGTRPVLQQVADELQLRGPLTGRVVSKAIVNKALLQVEVKYDDPALAAKIADATLAQIGQTVERIENGNIVVTEVNPAVVPSAPSNRNFVRNGAVGGVAGLVFGCFAAVGLHTVSDRGRRRKARHPA